MSKRKLTFENKMENLDTRIAELRNRAMRLRRVTEAIETSLLPTLVSYRDSLGNTPERCPTREDTKASLQTKAVCQRPEAMKVKEQPEESMVDGSPAGKDATIPDRYLKVQELSRNILRDRFSSRTFRGALSPCWARVQATTARRRQKINPKFSRSTTIT